MKTAKIIREATLQDFEDKLNVLLAQNWKIKKGSFVITESDYLLIMQKNNT